MIIPINHIADWRFICKHKQAQINKEFIYETTTRIDHDYRVGNKFLSRIGQRINTKLRS